VEAPEALVPVAALTSITEGNAAQLGREQKCATTAPINMNYRFLFCSLPAKELVVHPPLLVFCAYGPGLGLGL
jgi:hypothetical protein